MADAGQFVRSHRVWVAAIGAGAAAVVAVVLWQVLPSDSASNTASTANITAIATPHAQTGPVTQPVPTDAPSTDGLTTSSTQQPTGQPSAASTATAASEAADIQLILTTSATARSSLAQALPDLEACGNIQADVSQLVAAGQTRAELLRRTAGISTDLLPSGAVMMADLRRALTASIAADESYAAWGATLLREQPCNGSGSGDPHWAAAKAADVQATAAKSAFAALWNDLVPLIGVTPVQATQF